MSLQRIGNEPIISLASVTQLFVFLDRESVMAHNHYIKIRAGRKTLVHRNGGDLPRLF